MLQQHPARLVISGPQLAGVLAVIVLATAVLPPLAASRLNQSRIDRAASDARRIAAYLHERYAEPRTMLVAEDVVCGTGRLPKPGPAGVEWLGSPETRADMFGPDRPLDPWGRCYLANLGGLKAGAAVLLLSAGPNALIDTSIGAPAPQGDDVGVRVW